MISATLAATHLKELLKRRESSLEWLAQVWRTSQELHIGFFTNPWLDDVGKYTLLMHQVYEAQVTLSQSSNPQIRDCAQASACGSLERIRSFISYAINESKPEQENYESRQRSIKELTTPKPLPLDVDETFSKLDEAYRRAMAAC